MELQIEKRDDNVTLLKLIGRMDSADAQTIDIRFAGATARDHGAFIVDMSAVDFLASIGIRTLLMSAKAVKARGGRLVLLNPSPLVSSTLETVLRCCEDIKPLHGKPFADLRLTQDSRGCRVQLLHHLRPGVCGRKHAVPGRVFELRNTRFHHGWNFRRRRRAPTARNREGFQSAGLAVRQHARHVGDEHLNFSGEQRCRGKAGALVGNVQQINAGREFQQFSAHMRRATDTRRSESE